MDTDSLVIRVGFRSSPGAACVRACFLFGAAWFPSVPASAFVGSLEAFPAPRESVFLRWEDLTNGETGFLIERRPGEGEFEEVVTTPPNVIHYTDTGLEPQSTYTYRVRAETTGQELPFRQVEVTTLASWETARPVPRVVEGETAFTLEGAGLTYRLETSSDLEHWEQVGDTFPLASFESSRIVPDPDTGSTFFRIQAEAFERPSGIGLSRPFELPPEPDGEVYDVTDFGASPISMTNDDAIGIKVALSIAEPGDTVYIPEGTYTLRQVLQIPSGVSLKGAGMEETILITEGIDRAISILPEVHDVRLAGFTVRYLGHAEELAFGVYIGSVRQGRNSYRILIEDVRVDRFSVHGVSLRDCHHVLVQNCAFSNATNVGGGGHGYGVALNYPTNHDNWIRQNRFGPMIRHAVLIQYEAHNNLVEYNLAFENTEDAYDLHGEDEYANELRFNIARDGDRDGFGVGNTGSTHDRSGPNNWIHHNTVENSRGGIEIIQASDLVYVDHNTFVGNDYGIRVHNLGGNHLYLRGNHIEGNRIGVSLTSARWVWLEHNTIIGQSAYGIEILSGVEDLVDQNNTLSGNAVDYRP